LGILSLKAEMSGDKMRRVSDGWMSDDGMSDGIVSDGDAERVRAAVKECVSLM
jgi:hypothetical protein